VDHETLRMAREKKGWSLEELSRRAGIRLKAAEHIEQGQFAELPAGLYCRSTIRSYAAAVGLNPQEVLSALRPVLPSGEDPLDGLARRFGHSRKAEPKLVEPAPAADPAAHAGEAKLRSAPSALDLAEVVFRPGASPAPAPASARTLSMNEADAPARATTAWTVDRMRSWWRPLTASVIDGLLLATLGSALVWLTSIACGTTVPQALRTGAPGIALVFALIVALYFVLFGGVGNATPGVSLMRLEERTSGRTVLHARDVFGRACRSIFRDGSVLAE
jgi:transcriptional regulator with XRE-family HTH domain